MKRTKQALIFMFIILAIVAFCGAMMASCKDKTPDASLSVSLGNFGDLGAVTTDGKTITAYQGNAELTREAIVKRLACNLTSEGSTQSVSDIAVDWGGFESTQRSGEFKVTVKYFVGSVAVTDEIRIRILVAELTSVEVVDAPTDFVFGQDFSRDGLTVKLTYSDGKTSVITEGFGVDYSAYNKDRSGRYTIVVNYSEVNASFTATYEVNVGKAPFVGISVSGGKQLFKFGDEFTYDGLTAYASFADGSREDITSAITVDSTAYNSLATGKYTVKVIYHTNEYYDEKTYEVSVSDKVPESISVTGAKANFEWGEKFTSEGLVVTANYQFSSSQTVQSYTVNSAAFNGELEGLYEIIVSYTENGTTVKASYFAKVAEPKLSKITVKADLVKFAKGESFSYIGAKVTGYLEDGTSFEVSDATFDYAAFDKTALGSYDIVVSYTLKGVTKQASYSVTVVEAKLTSLELIKSPSKKRYKVGEHLNYTGIELLAGYSDGTNKTFTSADAGKIIAYGFTTNEKSAASTVSFYIAGSADVKTQGLFTYTVYDDIVSIQITKNPNKLVYHKTDTALDLTGMEYKINYQSSAARENIPYKSSEIQVTGLQNGTPALSKEATVVHIESGKMTYFTYAVEDRVTATIASNPKVAYAVGESLSLDGGAVAFYSDYGSPYPTEVAFSQLSNFIEGFNSTVATTAANLTLTLTDYSVLGLKYSGTFQIIYSVGSPTNIQLDLGTANPTTYKGTASFDYTGSLLSGATVNVTHSNGYVKSYVVSEMTNEEFLALFAVSAIDTSAVSAGVQVTLSVCGNSSIKTTFSCKVGEALKVATAIEMVTNPTKTSYYVHESLAIAGASVKVLHANPDDDYTIGLDSEELSVSFDFTYVGEDREVRVEYVADGELFTTFTVTVVGRASTSIALTTLPKVTYNVGESASYSGAVVHVVYGVGEPVDIDLWDTGLRALTEGFAVENFDTSQVTGAKTVTLKFDGDGDSIYESSTTFAISVGRTMSGIAIKSMPTKLAYKLGDALDLGGGVIEKQYLDGLGNEDVNMTTLTATGFDSTTAGTKTLSFAIGSYSVTLDVDVNAPKQLGFRLATASDEDDKGKTVADYGYTLGGVEFDWSDGFSADGLVLYVEYDYAYGDIMEHSFVKLPDSDFIASCNEYTSTSLDNLSRNFTATVYSVSHSEQTLNYQVIRKARAKYIADVELVKPLAITQVIRLEDASTYDASGVSVKAYFKWGDDQSDAGSTILTAGTDYTINAQAVTKASTLGTYNLVIDITSNTSATKTLSIPVTVADDSVVTLEFQGYEENNCFAWYGFSDLEDVITNNKLTLIGKDAFGTKQIEYSAANASDFTSDLANVATPDKVGTIITLTASYEGASGSVDIYLYGSPSLSWKAKPLDAKSKVMTTTTYAEWAADENISQNVIVLDFGGSRTEEISLDSPLLTSTWDAMVLNEGTQTLYIMLGTSNIGLQVIVDSIKVTSIEITTAPKTTYYEGYSIDLTVGEIKVTYSDETTAYKKLNDAGVTVQSTNAKSLSNFSVGEIDIIISYGGKTAGAKLTIIKDTVSDITVDTSAVKLAFANGESFTSDGLVITYKKASTGDVLQTATAGTDYMVGRGNFDAMENNWVEIGIIGIGKLSGWTTTYQVYKSATALTALSIASIGANIGSNFVKGYFLGGKYVLETKYGAGEYSPMIVTSVATDTASVSVSGVINTSIVYDGTNDAEFEIKVTDGTNTETYNAVIKSYVTRVTSIELDGSSVSFMTENDLQYLFDSTSQSVNVLLSVGSGMASYINGVSATEYDVSLVNGGSISIAVGFEDGDGNRVGEWESVNISTRLKSLITSLTVGGNVVAYVGGAYEVTLDAFTQSEDIVLSLADGYQGTITRSGVAVTDGTLPLSFGENEYTIRVAGIANGYFEDYSLTVNMPYSLAFDSLAFAVANVETKYEAVPHFTSYQGGSVELFDESLAGAEKVLYHKITLNEGFSLVAISGVNGAYDGIGLTGEGGTIIDDVSYGINYYTIAVTDGVGTASLTLAVYVRETSNGYNFVMSSAEVTVGGAKVQGDSENGYFVKLPLGYPTNEIKDSDIMVTLPTYANLPAYTVEASYNATADSLTINLVDNDTHKLLANMLVGIVRFTYVGGDVQVVLADGSRNVIPFALDGGEYKGTMQINEGGGISLKFLKDEDATLNFTKGLSTVIDAVGNFLVSKAGTYEVKFEASYPWSASTTKYVLTVNIKENVIVDTILTSVTLKDADNADVTLTHTERGTGAFKYNPIDDSCVAILSGGRFHSSYGFTDNGDSTGSLKVKFDISGLGSGITLWQGKYDAATHASATQITNFTDFVDLSIAKVDGVWVADFYCYEGGQHIAYEMVFIDMYLSVMGESNTAYYVTPYTSVMDLGEQMVFTYSESSGEYVLNCTNTTYPLDILAENVIAFNLCSFEDVGVYFGSTTASGTKAEAVDIGTNLLFGMKVFAYQGAFTVTSEQQSEMVFTIDDGNGSTYTFRIIVAK